MKSQSLLSLRATADVDFEQWLPLWDGIHTHHGSLPIDPEVSRRTFQRQREGCPRSGALRGLMAFLGDEPLGFAHYFLHQSSYQDAPVAQLEDLYVAETARGKGVGRALLAEVFARVQALGATEIRWVTSLDNTRALSLYESVGQREDMLSYRTCFTPTA